MQAASTTVVSAVVALGKHPKVADAFHEGDNAGVTSEAKACDGCGCDDAVVDDEDTLPAKEPATGTQQGHSVPASELCTKVFVYR